MAGIQTGIALNDNFSSVMYSVVSSVNQGISAIDGMQDTMGAPVDTTPLQGARDEINQATIAVQELNTAMQGMETPVIKSPAAPTWDTQSHIEVFDGAGLDRLSGEMNSLNMLSDDVLRSQQRIGEQALQMDVLPPNAVWDINMTSDRIEELGQKLANLQNIDVSTMDDASVARLNSEFENIRSIMNSIVNIQEQMNQAMENGDVSGLNAGYNQLNGIAEQVEQRIRDNLASLQEINNIQWQSDSLRAFTDTGIDRFQQEIQSANTMLGQLSSTQDKIARQAYSTNIFPPEAFKDLNNMAVRIDHVRAKIEQIESCPLNMGTDTANAELERLRSQLNHAVQIQGQLNTAMDNMDVSAANDAYLQLSGTISDTERYIRDNVNGQGEFNRQIQEGTRAAESMGTGLRGWERAIIVANQALGLVKSTLGSIGLFNLDGAFGRIDTMNQFNRTVTTMTGNASVANAALQQLKGTTLGTAYGLDVASKSTQGFVTRGMSIGKATDQVRIWADAVSFYGKGTNDQLENVVDAIGKMYSKGKVEASQLDRLFDAGIGAAEMYADAVGQSVSEVKEHLSSGVISAAEFIGTVSQALDTGISAGAAKDAGATWATTFANVQAAITRGWTNVLASLDAALADRGLPSSMEMITEFGAKAEEALNAAANAMGTVVELATVVYNTMSTAGGFIADNWSIIAPVIYGVVAALIVYNAVMGIGWLTTLKNIAAMVWKTAVDWAETAAIIAMTIAQEGLNAALAMCPLTWIIILVIALVAIFYAVVAAINKFAGTSISATGIICGVFAAAGAFIGNVFFALINFAIGIFCTLWNFIAAFANFFGNVFNDPLGAIARLFFDLADCVLGILESLASAIDTIFGSDLAGAVSGWRGSLGSWVDSTFGQGDEIMAQVNASDYKIDRLNYKEAWDAGYNFGEGIEDTVSSYFNPSDLFTKDVPGADDYADLGSYGNDATDGAGGIGNDVSDIAGNTGKIADSLDITSEELKYLRDIAEQETVNRYTTAEVTIKQTNNNNVSSDMDLDGVVTGLTDAMLEAVGITAKGVHI